MREEDRRNVILSALTTHYDGFTAETDNQGGHRDILARYDQRNLFICECRFWLGPESFTATIDQLFGYRGWRDTLAIVMYGRPGARRPAEPFGCTDLRGGRRPGLKASEVAARPRKLLDRAKAQARERPAGRPSPA
jgi:hypothetical protein